MPVIHRPLKFSSLTQVIPDIDHLLPSHKTTGQWSLGLICHHLRLAIELSMDGFPTYAPWLFRRSIGWIAGRAVLTLGWIPRGVPVPGWKIPTEPMDASREASQLGEAIYRFLSHTAPIVEHPILGRFSKKDWERFHCVHCAHHLSFASPA